MVEKLGETDLPQQDVFVPIPLHWALLGQRSVISAKTGKSYQIVEFDDQAGNIIGLFLTDMGRDETSRALVAKKRQLGAAIQRAVEYSKNQAEYRANQYSKQEKL